MKLGDEDNLVVYFVVALLSVANYPLDQTWRLKERLRTAGLCDPEQLMVLAVDDIANRLANAGYDRGTFMLDLLASRLRSVAERMISLGLEDVRDVLRGGDREELRRLFESAKGVGPTVIKNFLALRDN